jgi:cytochrome b involved in lipid metabolism
MGQKIQSSTQKFTEIVDFVDNIVVLEGGAACMIIEITASNFALLSKVEQDSRIFSYASLLNSLSFPIQIIIRNKRMDITSYLKELDEIEKTINAQQLKNYIRLYQAFVHDMVTVNVVLNKDFYIVIPYSSLEAGVTGAIQSTQKGTSQAQIFAKNAKKTLEVKANSILAQLQKFATSARILEKEDLIKLYYNIYNEGTDLQVDQIESGVNATMITVENKK